MTYTPYQLAGTYSSLLDTLQSSKVKEQQSQASVGKQKLKMSEDFQDELEKAQKAAEAKAKKHSGLFKGLNLLSSLFMPGPLGQAISKGIIGGAQAAQSKRGVKKLLSDVDMKRWGKTFLRDPMREYRQEAEDLQMSSGDVLESAFGSGMQGLTMAKMLGGEAGGDSLSKRIFKKGEGYVPAETASSVGVQTPDFVSDLLGDKAMSITPKASEMWKGTGESMGIRPDLISRPIGSVVEGAGRATPFKNLFDIFQSGTTEGKLDEMQRGMMIPMLLQMMMGGE